MLSGKGVYFLSITGDDLLEFLYFNMTLSLFVSRLDVNIIFNEMSRALEMIEDIYLTESVDKLENHSKSTEYQ